MTLSLPAAALARSRVILGLAGVPRARLFLQVYEQNACQRTCSACSQQLAGSFEHLNAIDSYLVL